MTPMTDAQVNSALFDEVEQLRSHLSQKQITIGDLYSQLGACEAEINDLRSQLSAREAELHETNERLITKTVEANGYHAELVKACGPVDMLLYCPSCGLQHVDAPDERTPDWNNPPHKSHLCHGCGYIWRTADVPTNGVKTLKTAGKADRSAEPQYLRCLTQVREEMLEVEQIRRFHEANWSCVPPKGTAAYEFRILLNSIRDMERSEAANRKRIAELEEQHQRDEIAYQESQAMGEKHRRNWVGACQEREELKRQLQELSGGAK